MLVIFLVFVIVFSFGFGGGDLLKKRILFFFRMFRLSLGICVVGVFFSLGNLVFVCGD